jgi:transposase InsO family protein
MPKLPLWVGCRVRFEGATHTVTGIDGPTMRLRSETGVAQLIVTVELLDASDFEILGLDYDEEAAQTSTFLDDLPDRVRRKAEKRLAHLNEVVSGFQSGDREIALANEPRPGYDPNSTTLEERVEAKRREKGWSRRTTFRDLRLYREFGLWGLVDKRQVRPMRGLNLEPQVLNATERVLQERSDKSTVSHDEIRRRVQVELDREHGPGVVACPPRSTFNRKLNELTGGRGTFGAAAKARRSIGNRPKTPYRRFRPTRPGEVVVIDSSPCDVFAYDPVSGQAVALELTMALDLYTRSLLAWRFTPRSAKGVDAALLLHDVVAWKPMRPGWPETARWRYHGVPDSIIVEVGGGCDGSGLPAGIPAVYPETVVVDRGRIYLSQAFQDGCARLGISIQLARPYRPTDKSHIERTFRTIRESLLEKLPGYKGPDVRSRGANPEDDACLSVGELEEIFAQWVATWWQVRHHSGLHLPGQPKIRLSPNEMYDEGIARCGLLYVPPSRTLYFELLPTDWRTVQHYGIDFNGLRYDGEPLDDFRNRTSPHNGVHKGGWPIRYDPRDLSQVYFHNPDSNDWHALAWVGQDDPDRPFSDLSLRYAKQLVRDRRGNNRNQRELEEVLNDLLTRAGLNEPRSRAEQRLAGKGRIHHWQTSKDRGELTPPLTLDSLPELDHDDSPGDLFDTGDLDFSQIPPMEMFDPDDDGLAQVAGWHEPLD